MMLGIYWPGVLESTRSGVSVNTALSIVAALGGLVVFIGAIWAVVRGIFRQVGATEDNTDALERLSGNIVDLQKTVTDQGERIARLEGRP